MRQATRLLAVASRAVASPTLPRRPLHLHLQRACFSHPSSSTGGNTPPPARRRRYRESEKLTRVLEKEAKLLQWDDYTLELTLAQLSRATRRGFNVIAGRDTSLDFYGVEMRDESMVMTVEGFKNMSGQQRIALGLPDQALVRLLELFVRQEEWEFEISDEEAHQRRLAEWMRFQPNTPGTDQSLDDLRKALPAKDFEYVRELADNPPRKAYPANWPVKA